MKQPITTAPSGFDPAGAYTLHMSVELHIHPTHVWVFARHDNREIKAFMITDTYKTRYRLSKPHNLPLLDKRTTTAKSRAIVELWTQP